MASSWITKNALTTILVGIEHVARASTRYSLAIGLNSELRRTSCPQVLVTTGNATISPAIHWRDNHWNVETVDKANVVVINGGEGKFGKRDGGFAGGRALEGVATAASLASAISIIVEVAARSGPIFGPPSPLEL